VRAVIQRVRSASVAVDGAVVGAIDHGLLVLLGAGAGDTDADLTYVVDKLVNLRIFADEAGKMNRSVLDVGGGVLVVSQFTLYGDAAKGRRPSFIDAARPEVAIPLYEAFLAALAAHAVPVASGEFGADMQVALINDGPVTLTLERTAP